jgi:hypothetical protein
MAAVRDIIKTFRMEIAVGKRTCDVSDKHIIKPGEQHFAYEEVPGNRKNVCLACAPAILKKAEAHLAKIVKAVNDAKG